jgi:hypothetical protein
VLILLTKYSTADLYKKKKKERDDSVKHRGRRRPLAPAPPQAFALMDATKKNA